MKKFALALTLVMVLSASAFAATTVTGWVQYGFTSQNNVINWDGLANGAEYAAVPPKSFAPQAAILVSGDNFGVRIDNTNPNGADFATSFSVARAYMKLPVTGVGTFTIGKNKLATSDNGALDTTYTGFGYTGSFDKLALNAVVAPGRDKNGDEKGFTTVGRGTYALDLAGYKTTLGATVKNFSDGNDMAWAVDGNVAFNSNVNAFFEYGQDKYDFTDPTADTSDQISAVGVNATVAGLALSGSYDLDNKAYTLSAEKTINNVLFHAEYDGDSRAATDAYAHADGKVIGYAKVSF